MNEAVSQLFSYICDVQAPQGLPDAEEADIFPTFAPVLAEGVVGEVMDGLSAGSVRQD